MAFDPTFHTWSKLAEDERQAICRRPALGQGANESAVREIIDAVRSRGDAALLEYTKRFDGVELASLEVSQEEFAAAALQVTQEERDALGRAYDNIHSFHAAQVPQLLEVETRPGLVCRRESRPIDRVGLYIPGGTAPLVSTVLMLAVPARIAGCPLAVLATPPTAGGERAGEVDPRILVAAELCGIDKVYKIGGAQAIAALAYGTDTVPEVDKVFGPGNTWVTLAKQLVSQDAAGAACDMPAGPSEVLVIADADSDAECVASDLLSQAEHGEDSQVVLVAADRRLAESVVAAVNLQLQDLSRSTMAEKSLAHSLVIVVDSTAEAILVSNLYAPEHLIIHSTDADALVPDIRNAGSVFLGPWTPESLGDYASGTNHVLPTYGWARSVSGVSLDSYLKQITFQKATAAGLQDIGPAVEALATMEGLDAHRNAVSLRLRKLNDSGGSTA